MTVIPDVATGATLRDRYEVRAALGTGGMGTVWSAHDHRLDRPVAIKLLRTDVPGSAAARMEREARAAVRIDDPRVVGVLDLDHLEDGRPFIVLELHDGWTLAQELQRGSLPPARFAQLVDDLLGGLGAAHDRGVLHRDVKPGNVLADTGRFRITDFGLASMDTDPSTDPELMGTLAYLAPERLQGAAGTTASDVFAAAVVLHEAATGSRPFHAETPGDALARIRTGEIPSLPDHVPASVAAAIRSALAADPAARPRDATELLAATRGHAAIPYVTDETVRLDVSGVTTAPAQVRDPDDPTTRFGSGVATASNGRPPRRPGAGVHGTERPRAPRRVGGSHHTVLVFVVTLVVLLATAAWAGLSGVSDDADAGTTGTDAAEVEERLDETLSRLEELGS